MLAALLCKWRLSGFRAALALIVCAMPAYTCAAGLQVSPVSLTIPAGQPGAGIWLINSGKDLVNAQVRLFEWTQPQGEDAYGETEALVISPPFLRLEPGQRQLIRVIRSSGVSAEKPDRPAAAPDDKSVEHSYRLIIDELPIQDGKHGIQFVMRYSVPVFLPPSSAKSSAPVLNWHIQQDEGSSSLVVSNTGAVHAQLADVVLSTAAGRKIEVRKGLLGYVLPGATVRWPIAALPDSGDYTAKALLNGAAASGIRISGG